MSSHLAPSTSGTPPPSPVVIVGGGFAGLSAAVELAGRGERVLLLERRPFLGGRAYSFADRVTGDVVDNGQHLMMGCYHRTLGFLGMIGALDKLKIQERPRVDFVGEREGHAEFKCPAVPAPWHLLAGLTGLGTIGWRDRLGAVRLGLALRRLNGGGARLGEITVREWLTELGQTPRMQRRFWDPIALATLNESPDCASADMFARVLDQAFLHGRRDSAMVISRVGLSDLYTEDARRFVEARGGEVRLNAAARIEFDGARARGVVLAGGERIAARAVISAVPYFALEDLLGAQALGASPGLRGIRSFRSAPIVSINLWYERAVTDLEFTGLLDSPIEWVFNKTAIAGSGAGGRQHLALVISGAHDAVSRPKDELVALAVRELARFFPAARGARPVHSVVVKERDATISHTVGTARLRPAQRTEWGNLFLAGDWTATGLPATIEGAVSSGVECARAVLEMGHG